MKKCLKYSVLRYSPSTITGERINLGIVVYDELLDLREFRYTKKFKRLSSFDDEIDINTIKLILQDIREDLSVTLLSEEHLDVEDYIKFYNNDLHFDSPKQIEYDDFDETIDSLFKIYFRFDYEKKDRPDKTADVKLLEELIKAKSIEYKKNQPVVGEFDENIRYDLVTPEHNIKVFDFDGKDLSKVINTAKVWAFNAMTSKEIDKLIYIYRYSDELKNSNPDFDSIKKIFDASKVKFCNFEDGIQEISRIS